MLVLAVVAMEVKQFLRKSLQGISTSSQHIKLRNAAFILSTCGSVMRLHVLPSFFVTTLHNIWSQTNLPIVPCGYQPKKQGYPRLCDASLVNPLYPLCWHNLHNIDAG